MEILLDNNSFDFLSENIDKIIHSQKKYTFYYILSQEIELDKLKIKQLDKYLKLVEIKEKYTSETAGGFMLNAPCLNRLSLFPDEKTINLCSDILKKHHCEKKGRPENFTHDLNLALTANAKKYTVLTNDGTGGKDGLYPALKELGINCYSHSEFLNLI